MSLKEIGGRDLSRVDLLDRIRVKGVVINGAITVTVGSVELLSIKVNLVIASLETAKRFGLKLPWEEHEEKSKIRAEENARSVSSKSRRAVREKSGRIQLTFDKEH